MKQFLLGLTIMAGITYALRHKKNKKQNETLITLYDRLERDFEELKNGC